MEKKNTVDGDVDLDLDLLMIELESTVKAQARQLKRQTGQLQRQERQIARLQQQLDELTPSIVAAREHVWDLHTDHFLERLDAAFARTIGTETLTPEQRQGVRAAFGGHMPNRHTDPAAFATFARRYAALDDTLIDEFLREYLIGEQLLKRTRGAVTPIFIFGAIPHRKMN